MAVIHHRPLRGAGLVHDCCTQAGDVAPGPARPQRDDRRLVLAGGLCVLHAARSSASGIAGQRAPCARASLIWPSATARAPRQLRSHRSRPAAARRGHGGTRNRRQRQRPSGSTASSDPNPAPELLRELRWAARHPLVGMVVSARPPPPLPYLIGHVDAPGNRCSAWPSGAGPARPAAQAGRPWPTRPCCGNCWPCAWP